MFRMFRRIAAPCVLALIAASGAAQYSVSGNGGAIPSGAPVNSGGGGVWPSTLPPILATSEFSLTTPVPAIATNIKRVTLTGLTHTWIGDLQLYLVSPSGVGYSLVHRVGYNNFGASAAGYSANYGGDYTIVAAGDGSINQAWPVTNPNNTSLILPSGIYPQEHGTLWHTTGWPSGTHNTNNVPLTAIPIVAGTWKLKIHDWVGADFGALTSFTIEGDTTVVPPSTYCTAGTSTNGCVPSISATENPSASLASSCVITAASIEGQKAGIAFYGLNNSGFVPTIWGAGSNSFLCVKSPVQRMAALNSGGTVNSCNGVLTQSWNAFQSANPTALGNPFAAGDKVYAQMWYRDPPAVRTTNLTNALDMTVVP